MALCLRKNLDDGNLNVKNRLEHAVVIAVLVEYYVLP